MRTLSILTSLLLGYSIALPSIPIQKRQIASGVQITQNDLTSSGECKKVTFIFARASTERGNMGGSMGPIVCSGLKKNFPGEVACQGVGAPYSASIGDNLRPSGTSAAAIAEAKKMFNLASTQCPETIIVAGGYSQGTAVMMNALSTLEPETKKKVVGVVLFGYTKNGQQKGGIPDFPQSRVKVFCAQDDGVCWGKLSVTNGHFSYMRDGTTSPGAIGFLTDQINESTGGLKSRKDGGIRGLRNNGLVSMWS